MISLLRSIFSGHTDLQIAPTTVKTQMTEIIYVYMLVDCPRAFLFTDKPSRTAPSHAAGQMSRSIEQNVFPVPTEPEKTAGRGT